MPSAQAQLRKYSFTQIPKGPLRGRRDAEGQKIFTQRRKGIVPALKGWAIISLSIEMDALFSDSLERPL